MNKNIDVIPKRFTKKEAIEFAMAVKIFGIQRILTWKLMEE